MFVSFLSALRRALAAFLLLFRAECVCRSLGYVRSGACIYSTKQFRCLHILHLSGYLKKTQSTAFYMPPNVSFKISLNSAAFVSCKSPAKIGFNNNFCCLVYSTAFVRLPSPTSTHSTHFAKLVEIRQN